MVHHGKGVLPAFRALFVAALSVLLIPGASPRLLAADALRPPAVPLVACDPYFSVWSFTDRLTDSDTVHWTGTRQSLSSLIRIDGKSYRLMGSSPTGVAAFPQVALKVLPTRTLYEFEGAGIHLSLIFMTALLPSDLQLLSRPVTYLTWKLRSVDGKEHLISLYFDSSAELVVNTTDEPVIWSREQIGGLNVMRMGTVAQPILANSGDDRRIDWGYLYLALPATQVSQSVIAEGNLARGQFTQEGSLPRQDDTQMPRPAADRMPVLATVFAGIKVGPSSAERHLLLLYDDLYSVELLHQRLRPYWRAKGADAKDLLREAARDYDALQSKCGDFDREFMDDLIRIGGRQYAELAAIAYRQSLAASKIAAAPNGEPLFFEKENFSDGSISTPDVLFPQSPILLLFNPTLLRASLVPIFEYVTSGRWKFPFAPAQLGTYPLANGQTYGGGETSEEGQQPVEETGDMMIMTAAVARMEKKSDLAAQYWPVLTHWAEYLKANGLDPGKQLCTDDFAGPLAHNANLSLKAIEALGAYALLCEMREDPEDAAAYRKTAEEYARRWITMARDGDHFRLAFDQPGTWGQKYNLVWDRLLGLNLFPREIARTEISYYERHLLKFGWPLDSRSNYTKLDWEVWSASLADSQADFQKLMSPVFRFVDQTPSRVPLPDWYYATDGKQCLYHTKAGRQIGFQARPVVGGAFMKVLMDPPTWKKWSERAGIK